MEFRSVKYLSKVSKYNNTESYGINTENISLVPRLQLTYFENLQLNIQRLNATQQITTEVDDGSFRIEFHRLANIGKVPYQTRSVNTRSSTGLGQ